MRFLAAWFPDWPVTAAGYRPQDPVAFAESGAISACSAAAFQAGVRVGQRRREAKRHCPLLTLLPNDPYRDAQAFEPVVAALTMIVPRIEVTAPGLATMAAEGPSRYYGGEQELASLVVQTASEALSTESNVQIGIADSRFAADLAAQQFQIVAPGLTREFLAPFPVATLGLDDLTTLSRRLGIHTLGQFAELPSRSVLSRFGTAAAVSHQLARGEHHQPLAIHEPAVPLTVSTELDPPAERVDIATFAARALASELADLLARRGLACTQLRIDAETEHAETLSRLWRASTVFDAETIVERVRWQLAGWLDVSRRTAQPKTGEQPTAGISLLRLSADEVAGSADLQISLWGEMSEADRRAVRGLDRVRGLLGPGGVFTAVLRGGRGPADRMQLVPWGEPAPPGDQPMPWPGHVTSPAPALVHPDPLPVEVAGVNGPVGISVRGEISNAPARIRLPDNQWQAITAWAGPWLTEEQWWDPEAHRRQARFQIVTEESGAHLCTVRRNHWWIEATYD